MEVTPEIQNLRDRRARIASAISRLNKLMDRLWEQEIELRAIDNTTKNNGGESNGN